MKAAITLACIIMLITAGFAIKLVPNQNTKLLEGIQSLVNWLTVLSTLGVFLGVYYEDASPITHKIGKNLLLGFLALEILLGFLSIQVTSRIEYALNQKLESEKLARLKIQEKMAWRNLDSEQIKRIADKINDFPNQKYFLSVNVDVESTHFLEQIRTTLNFAHWLNQPPPENRGDIIVTEVNATADLAIGVHIEYAPSAKANLLPVVQKLVEALKAENIQASARPGNLESELHPDVIVVVVGSKP